MIVLPRPKARRRSENTIALINIVFLLLMFFLVAGTLAPTPDGDITLIEAGEADSNAVSNLLGLRADGTLVRQGDEVTVDQAITALSEDDKQLFLAVDRDTPAKRLIRVVTALRDAGAETVTVLTERAP